MGPFVITSHIFEYVYILLPLLVGALGPGFLTEQPDGAEELFLDFPADTFDILHAALVCGKYGALFSLWSKEKNKKYQNNTQVWNQEDGWQIIGVHTLAHKACTRLLAKHAHACSQSRSNINDMAEVHVSILWL